MSRPAEPTDEAPAEGPLAAVVHEVEEVAAPVVETVHNAVDTVHDAVEAAGEVTRQAVETTARAAEVAETHRAVSAGARFGFLLDGLLHVAMGWAGLQVVWIGRSTTTADESGALTAIATTLGGRAVLWVSCVGFAVVTVWNLARAVTGRHCHTRLKRLEHAADGIAYATVAWAAAAFAIGAGQTSRDSTVGITRSLLGLPGGVLLVVGTGIAVAGVGVFSIWSGLSRDFLLDLARPPGRLLVSVGILGFVTRGVAFAVVGLLFVIAARTHDVTASTGIDGALHFLQQAPAGRWALAVVSVGLVAFGVYLMTRARHLRA
ncbi:DUF1206 domain-containing protein [Phycicoccus sonneratiae]|uniref:DUF1206 domain-containing protein n=1 Tax=Phycicoccus sonneratiae TaxID=2807628 RepID=A0ABS2CNY4_9MICO|nr:DUF1206 domain-containing protein [Phycicoccus sonneraticus]MBM6401596.1 DUF1206 domain-containing protein [Phycicoccus sonneraticus]